MTKLSEIKIMNITELQEYLTKSEVEFNTTDGKPVLKAAAIAHFESETEEPLAEGTVGDGNSSGAPGNQPEPGAETVAATEEELREDPIDGSDASEGSDPATGSEPEVSETDIDELSDEGKAEESRVMEEAALKRRREDEERIAKADREDEKRKEDERNSSDARAKKEVEDAEINRKTAEKQAAHKAAAEREAKIKEEEAKVKHVAHDEVGTPGDRRDVPLRELLLELDVKGFRDKTELADLLEAQIRERKSLEQSRKAHADREARVSLEEMKLEKRKEDNENEFVKIHAYKKQCEEMVSKAVALNERNKA